MLCGSQNQNNYSIDLVAYLQSTVITLTNFICLGLKVPSNLTFFCCRKNSHSCRLIRDFKYGHGRRPGEHDRRALYCHDSNQYSNQLSFCDRCNGLHFVRQHAHNGYSFFCIMAILFSIFFLCSVAYFLCILVIDFALWEIYMEIALVSES